jgi:hypothetical protein
VQRSCVSAFGVRLVLHVDSFSSRQWLHATSVEDLLSPSLGDLWQTFAPSTDDAACEPAERCRRPWSTRNASTPVADAGGVGRTASVAAPVAQHRSHSAGRGVGRATRPRL